MSWLKKQLKRTTKILDPVGNQLRKSTGGSYGDPMNWYNSKPNTNPPWEARKSPGLIAAPGGPAPQGQSFGQNTGGYSYIPNRFSGGVATPPPGAPNVPSPSIPGGAGAMTFGGGGGGGGGGNLGAMGGVMGSAMSQAAAGAMPQYQPPPPQQLQAQTSPMQNQMIRIGAVRGSGYV